MDSAREVTSFVCVCVCVCFFSFSNPLQHDGVPFGFPLKPGKNRGEHPKKHRHVIHRVYALGVVSSGLPAASAGHEPSKSRPKQLAEPPVLDGQLTDVFLAWI